MWPAQLKIGVHTSQGWFVPLKTDFGHNRTTYHNIPESSSVSKQLTPSFCKIMASIFADSWLTSLSSIDVLRSSYTLWNKHSKSYGNWHTRIFRADSVMQKELPQDFPAQTIFLPVSTLKKSGLQTCCLISARSNICALASWYESCATCSNDSETAASWLSRFFFTTEKCARTTFTNVWTYWWSKSKKAQHYGWLSPWRFCRRCVLIHHQPIEEGSCQITLIGLTKHSQYKQADDFSESN